MGKMILKSKVFFFTTSGFMFLFALAAFAPGCKNGGNGSEDAGEDTDGYEDGGEDGEDGIVERVTLSGAVQKGPFVLGTTVSVSPVDSSGNPTGQFFSTQTINDLGEFNLEFSYTGLVSLEGNGFYYNEVTGALSDAQLVLRAYYEVSEAGTQSAYINSITHLSYNRVKALMDSGEDYENALAQAEEELRTAMEIGPPGFDPQADGIEMNILGGENLANAYLFAVSAVLVQAAMISEGIGSVDAKLQELISTISLDLGNDGDISSDLKDLLYEAQLALDRLGVMDMLAQRLALIGSDATVPDLDLVLDLDRDGQVNADDCLIYDPQRWTGHADGDADGHDHIRCGGDDCDDDCATCYPGTSPVCGEARDHDCDGIVDDLGQCVTCTPGSPYVVGRLSTLIQFLFVVGDTVYGGSLGGDPGDPMGFEVFDVSNPTAPSRVALVAEPGQNPETMSIAVYGDLACVIGSGPESDPDRRHAMRFYDVSVPSSPQLLSTWGPMPEEEYFYFSKVAATAGRAYLLVGRLISFDTTDPLHPMLLGASEDMGGSGLFVVGNYAYVLGVQMIHVLDVSSEGPPRMIGEASLPFVAPPGHFNIFVSGQYAYITCSGDPGEKFYIVDVSNPASPAMVHSSTLIEHTSGLFVAGDHAYISTDMGLTVQDVTTPTSPTTAIRHVPGVRSGSSVFVAGSHAYVAGTRVPGSGEPSSELLVIDLDCDGLVCGNGVVDIDKGESCDGAVLRGWTCEGLGFDGGTLACNAHCRFDTSGCVTPVNCGNGTIDSGEQCDGANLGEEVCALEGTLACTPQCTFDTTWCVYSWHCGNGGIDMDGEQCDGADTGGADCLSFGFGEVSGEIPFCRNNCTFDFTSCTFNPDCGNGVVDGSEQCDGTDIPETCQDWGYSTGTLSCQPFCVFDWSDCEY